MNLTNAAEMAIVTNSINHHDKWGAKKPTMQYAARLLAEENQEFQMAVRGEHSDSPALELIQMGGLCINILRQFYTDEEIREQLTIETKRHFPEMFPNDKIILRGADQ